MNKIQNELLTLFKEFIKITAELKLEFIAEGGTVLGAVRHQGFIPWDDDIDLAMKYDDILKLMNFVNSKKSRYKIIYHKNKKNYMGFYFKFIDTLTNIEAKSTYQNKSCDNLWLDIFIIMPFKQGTIINNINKKILDISFQIFRSKKMVKYSFEAKEQKLFYRFKRFVSAALFFWLPSWNIIEHFYKRKWDNKDSVIISFHGVKEYSLRDYYNSTKILFEDIYIPVPNNYKKYLTIKYGNWQKIPEVSDRVNHEFEIL